MVPYHADFISGPAPLTPLAIVVDLAAVCFTQAVQLTRIRIFLFDLCATIDTEAAGPTPAVQSADPFVSCGAGAQYAHTSVAHQIISASFLWILLNLLNDLQQCLQAYFFLHERSRSWNDHLSNKNVCGGGCDEHSGLCFPPAFHSCCS